ncbi:hypothetical protein HT031_003433 [Scenedesmus sp. PABB004]|nr:hypothetical protein HT031_003433 [Scenedesmus sp. PABB004]
MDAEDGPLPRTASKSLRMDIARMVAIEVEVDDRQGHALSPTEHATIMGHMDAHAKRLALSNSLRKRSLDLPVH